MKKYAKLLLMLAVVGVAMSCEKETDHGYEQSQPVVIDPEVEVAKAETAKFYGLWVRTVNYPEGYNYNHTHCNWEWRFNEDGTSYLWRGKYKGDCWNGLSSGRVVYEVKDGKFRWAYYGDDEEMMEWDYVFEGDTLTISREYEGEDIVWTFEKSEDADDKLVGCWDAIVGRGPNGEYIERHYKFHTPTYGSSYDVTYNSTGTASQDVQHRGDFRYRIDGDCISFFYFGGIDYSTKLYYRLVGTKLYLRTSPSGEEVMYSNFYAENGIPFRP